MGTDDWARAKIDSIEKTQTAQGKKLDEAIIKLADLIAVVRNHVKNDNANQVTIREIHKAVEAIAAAQRASSRQAVVLTAKTTMLEFFMKHKMASLWAMGIAGTTLVLTVLSITAPGVFVNLINAIDFDSLLGS